MTTVPWTISEKIYYYFVICPIHDFLFPKSKEEIEKEKQEAMLRILARDHPYVTVGGYGKPNRKQDGEELGRP